MPIMDFLNDPCEDGDRATLLTEIRLTSIMLFPGPEEAQTRDLWCVYTLLAQAEFRHHQALADGCDDERACCQDIGRITGDQVASVGGWEKTLQTIFNSKISPRQLWLNTRDRKEQGLLAGAALGRRLNSKVGMKLVAEKIMAPYSKLATHEGAKTSAPNLNQKWWPQMRPAAHLWCAALDVAHQDKGIFHLVRFGHYFRLHLFEYDGILGFLSLSQEEYLRRGAECLPATSTKEPILRPDESWLVPDNIPLLDPHNFWMPPPPCAPSS